MAVVAHEREASPPVLIRHRRGRGRIGARSGAPRPRTLLKAHRRARQPRASFPSAQPAATRREHRDTSTGMATGARQSTTVITPSMQTFRMSSRSPSPANTSSLLTVAFTVTSMQPDATMHGPKAGRRVGGRAPHRGGRRAGFRHRRRRTRRQPRKTGRRLSGYRWISGRRRRIRRAMETGRRPNGRPPQTGAQCYWTIRSLDDLRTRTSSAQGPDAFSGAALLRRLRSNRPISSPVLAPVLRRVPLRRVSGRRTGRSRKSGKRLNATT